MIPISIGQKFSRWTVTGADARVPRRDRPGGSGWRAATVVCDCGESDPRAVKFRDLLNGSSKSCGCLQREWAGGLKFSHGLHDHYLFDTWRHMVARCHTPGAHNYEHYGARGIQVYEPWRTDPAAFFDWIEANLGPRPEGVTDGGIPAYSLDRENNDGNYEPGNLRWATWRQQKLNQRPPRRRKAAA